MKTRFTKLIPIVFISLTLFLNVEEVEGKSVVWNQGDLPALYYFGDNGLGAAAGGWWLLGLQSGANVSIVYNAQIRNADTGVVISDGASIPISTRLIFEKIQHVDTDISWNGTGFTSDTPYGTWQSGASAPANPLLYFVDTTIWFPLTTYTETYYNYIPLSVNQPAVSTLSLSSNLSCVGGVCTVTASGPISASVVFDATYGKFYYKYIGPPGYPDYYNKVAMRGCFVSTTPFWGGPSNGECVSFPASNYLLPIPPQTITFSLTAVSSNNPPTAPTITGVSSANLGTTNTFTFNATDPDNDTIKYEIDWNNDGTVDGLSPTSGFVSSGSNSTSNYTLPSTGTTFTFKARTADSKGGVSAWTTKTVTLLQAINGECGQANGEILSSAPSGAALCFTPGVASSITTNPTTWTWTCSGTNGGNPSPTCTTTKQGPMVNVYFSLLDRLKLFTSNLLSNSTLIDRVLAKEK